MNFTIKEDETAVIITIEGIMELRSIAEFKNKIAEISSAPTRDVVLNLKDVEYIDSTAISILISLYRQLKQHGKTLKILNPNPRVASLLELSSLSELLQ